MPRILIEGDSWAYVWDNHNVSTPGFYSMISGFDFHCTAKAGSSNAQILQRIRDSHESWDLCIVILTEQIRDWLTIEGTTKIWNTYRMVLDLDSLMSGVKNSGGLDQYMHLCLRSYFEQLNSLGKPVWLIGGCSLVPLALLEGLDNLRSPIASVVELLLPGCKDCIYQDTHQWQSREYADWVIAQHDISLIKEWYRITAETRDKIDRWQYDKVYFFPDKWHPNLQGHRKIAEALEPLLRQHFDQTVI